MSNFIVRGKSIPAPDGLIVTNHVENGLPSLRNQARTGKVTQVIVHETVTSSAKSTVDVLQQRKLGVHLIVGPEGFVYQHADLAADECWHASEHNDMSVGIETVNPFSPKYAPSMGPWSQKISCPWAGGDYLLPTRAQSEAVALLLQWLTSPDSELSIEKLWPGMTDQTLTMGRTPKSDLGPGIYAHHYFASHVDGPWLVLYAWLRLEAGLDPDSAYDEAVRRAPGMNQIDLSDLFVNK